MSHSAFHFVAVLHYFISLFYNCLCVDLAAVSPIVAYHWSLKVTAFLTKWNFLLQALFFTVCFINDLVGTNEMPESGRLPLIRRFKDLLLPCLAFPLSMFVGLTFWGLYMVDRELVFPKVLDEYFPTWLNHCMHTNIMIFILIEMATSYRKYPKRSFGLKILIGFMAVYLVWIHIIHSYTGMWVYPILDVLNLPMRVVFFAGLLVLSTALYVFGEKLNDVIWNCRQGKNKVA